MSTGIYRDHEEVMVDYGTYRTIIPRYRYETNHYEPPFDRLPTRQEVETKSSNRTGM